MATITLKIPDKLDIFLDQYIKNGWAISKDEVITDALKRYMDSHREEIIEDQLMKDVEWGLNE